MRNARDAFRPSGSFLQWRRSAVRADVDAALTIRINNGYTVAILSSSLRGSISFHHEHQRRTTMSKADNYLDARSQFAFVDGMRVHFRREGRGSTLVLLHGSGSSLHSFDAVASRLTGQHEVVRLDLPGCGLTGPRPDRDYRIETYVSFLEHFLSELSIDRFSLAGNSLGGNIAWNFALDHPARVERLILMNATGYPGKSLPLAMRLARHSVGRALLRRLFSRSATARNLRKLVGPRMRRVDERLIDRIHALMSVPGNRQAFIDFANTTQRDRSGEIHLIGVPTLVLRGESVDGQHFCGDLPRCHEIVYPGVGHLLPDEAPDEVAAAVRTHLEAR